MFAAYKNSLLGSVESSSVVFWCLEVGETLFIYLN